MALIDTHSHIYDDAFDQDREQAIERAKEAGVEHILMPAIDSESHGALFETAREYSGYCLPMMGLHPTSVNENPNYRKELEAVEYYLANPPEGIFRFYAIGEVGLDLYWSREWEAQQREVFKRQIELSVRYKLPLVIHTREAWSQMTEMLGEYKGCGLRGVMHAFSGTLEDYGRLKEIGEFLFGIGGVVTYKKSGVAEMLAGIPIEDIMLETDCPYLTPVPFRGKRNESAYISYICAKVAEIYRLNEETVAGITADNAKKLFDI